MEYTCNIYSVVTTHKLYLPTILCPTLNLPINTDRFLTSELLLSASLQSIVDNAVYFHCRRTMMSHLITIFKNILEVLVLVTHLPFDILIWLQLTSFIEHNFNSHQHIFALLGYFYSDHRQLKVIIQSQLLPVNMMKMVSIELFDLVRIASSHALYLLYCQLWIWSLKYYIIVLSML